MNFNNDLDIKKYNIGKNFSTDINEPPSIDDFLFQKSNGNLDKAKQLGINLGKYISIIDKNICKDKNYKIKLFINNKKILLLFAAISALESSIKNEYVLSTAKTSINEFLQFSNRNFYDIINTSAALSFFTLCQKKRDGNNIKCYGKYFAILCEQENNNRLMQIGSNLYIIFFNLSKNEIKKYNLKY